MPNHVHLILTPTRADGLGLAVREAHRRYTNFINARGRWTGHLFQSRFASVAINCCNRYRVDVSLDVSLTRVDVSLTHHRPG
jgi:REP element-mobilizing transposase RayT